MSQQKQKNLEKIAQQLGATQVAMRQDLKVSRVLFKGQPSYIVHDPVSFQSQRFSPQDYEIISALSNEVPLSEIFEDLIGKDILAKDEEHGFYKFVLDLQLRGLLDLPITNSKHLYARFQKRQQAQKKGRLMKMLFWQVPLFNPNEFLDRTMRFARPLFTKSFFIFWCLLMLVAGVLLYARWSDFVSPMANLFATRNLILMFVVMTVLKFWHELGHAYACKRFGGAVPDMGALFIASAPCAYVDVSSSWSFPSRRCRIIVALGGMYFESIAAAIATIAWALTGPSMMNSIAHYVVLMAGFITLLFNANPLMRFDGYYVLSDLLGIPNLRQRASEYVSGLTKKVFLGIDTPGFTGAKDGWTLGLYGISAGIYRCTLVISISMMVASNFLIAGLFIGGSFIATTAIDFYKNVINYVYNNEECEPVRNRAIGLAALLLIGGPMLLMMVPVPTGVISRGVVSYENIQTVRFPESSFLGAVHVKPGQKVSVGQSLLQMESDQVQSEFRLASAQLKLAEVQLGAFSGDPQASQQQLYVVENRNKALDDAKRRLDELKLESEIDGTVVQVPEEQSLGAYYPAGTELARVASGRAVINVIASSEQLSQSMPKIGQSVTCRLSTAPTKSIKGTIQSVRPAGSSDIQHSALTQLAGGDILVNPTTGESDQPYFQYVVLLNEQPAKISVNTTATVRLDRRYETMASFGIRKVRSFLNKLATR